MRILQQNNCLNILQNEIKMTQVQGELIVIYVPVLCALWSVMRYYGPTVLIVGLKKPVFEGLKFSILPKGLRSPRPEGKI